MESRLESEFNAILNSEHVVGCVVADSQGLCLMSSPNQSDCTSGLVTALAQHAAKMDPLAGSDPVIVLESDSRQCLIQRDGGITTAVFRDFGGKG